MSEWLTQRTQDYEIRDEDFPCLKSLNLYISVVYNLKGPKAENQSGPKVKAMR